MLFDHNNFIMSTNLLLRVSFGLIFICQFFSERDFYVNISFIAGIAQLVEQTSYTRPVEGSSPSARTM